MIARTDLEAHLVLATNTDTELLIDLEAAAVRFVESYTHRYFGAAGSVTEYVRGSGTRELWLSEVPTAVTSVHYQPYPGGTQTAVVAGDDDGFETRAGKAVLYRKGGAIWHSGYEWVVVYTRGYPQTAAAAADTPADIAAPDEIRQAVKEVTAALYRKENRVGAGLQSESLGDYGYTRPSSGLLEVLPSARATLERYRRVFV